MAFDPTPIELALINGNIITVNQSNDICEAVGVKGNRVVFVGTNAELALWITDRTKVIDLKGRSLTPGFIDTHYHPILHGFFGNEPGAAIINTGYDNCQSIEQILDLVRKAVDQRAPGEWISMMGYDQNRIAEKRHVTKEELDQAAPNNPVQCMRTCGHISIYNTKALEAIGVFRTKDADKYPKNEIVVENGKLTGMVKDHTHFLLWSKVTYTPEQQEAAALKSNGLLLRNGVTSVHDPGECDASSYHMMQTLCRERRFKPRVYSMLHSIFGKPFSLKDNAYFLNLGLMTGLGDAYFRIGSCKFMIDGGTSGPSCATRQPYSHDPTLPGILGWEREETADYIRQIHDADCQATAHAVGDLAVEFMVEGYEKAFVANPRKDARHRIEHCAIVDADLIRRMANMGICPSCNPGFLAWNGRNYNRFYGQRMKYFMALKSMMEAGVKVSIGSDAPSGPIDVPMILDACVNRIDRVTGEPVDPTQCIEILDAIRMFTYNGAYASFEEGDKGSIEVGKLADFCVFSENLTETPNDRIRDIQIDLTLIDGRIEFDRLRS